MTRSASNHPPRVVDAQFVLSTPSAEHFPPPVGIEIAFGGRSNVGKSSLLNALLGRRNLARTSSTPGCTRQISFFQARASDGVVLTMVDLPGYGYAKRSKTERAGWAELVESYLLTRPTLTLLIALVDVRRGLEADDLQLLRLVASPAQVSRAPVETLLVATKTDRLALAARKPALSRLRRQAERPMLAFSIKDPRSHARLWQKIRSAVGIGSEAAAGA